MQKRVIHKPKAYILKIELNDDKVGEVSHALELFLPDGTKLTKEMLDAMDLSTDSDEVKEEKEVINEKKGLNELNLQNENLEKVVEMNTQSNDKEGLIELNTQGKINEIPIESDANASGKETLNKMNTPANIKATVSIGNMPKRDIPSHKETIPNYGDEFPVETYVFTPPTKIVSKITRYTIDFMLNCEEREEIALNIDKSMLKKPDSNVQKFRIEMNRIAWKNLDEVVRTVKYLKFTRAEMKKCSEILFEKAVGEETFAVLYAALFDRLRDFYYFGETREEAQDSYIFTSIVQMCNEAINNRQSWRVIVDEAMKNNAEITDDEKDEALIKSNMVKDHTFGVIRFLMIMAINDIVDRNQLKDLVISIIKNKGDEEAEMMTLILNNSVTELFSLDNQFFESLIVYMKELSLVTKEARIRFMIIDTIDLMQKTLQGEVRVSKLYERKIVDKTIEPKEDEVRFRRGARNGSDRFSRSSVNDVTSKLGSLGIKSRQPNPRSKISLSKPERTRNEPFTVQNSFDISKKVEKITDADLTYCKNIIDEMSYYNEEDIESSLQEVNRDIRSNKISKSSFTTSFILQGLKSNDWEDCIKYYIYASKALSIDSKIVYNGLLYVKDLMEDLIIDFPNTKNRYENFCDIFKKRGLIDREQQGKLTLGDLNNGDAHKKVRAIHADEKQDK